MNSIQTKSVRLFKYVKFTLLTSKQSHNLASSLSVFNSLNKSKEPLKLRNDNLLYWYSCGPTVYDSAHIGHACSYVNFDIIKRILTKYFQITVVDLMNITDIDDKIIKKSLKEGKKYNQISEHYEKEFIQDLSALNCQRPSIILKVTKHIPEIIEFIGKLVDSKQAYATGSGSVYFDTQAFSVKSFFSVQDPENELDSKENKEKRHPFDFALWKGKKDANEPSWNSPWGEGRPGWHIECSTLAAIAFGQHLDFHSGGKDLLFPHHHNEMTQCCAYFKIDKWSSFWLHTGHLHLNNDVKMSKSLSNTISISELLKKYSSNEFRFFCLLSHYRFDKEFSEDKMIKPVKLSNTFNSFVKYCQSLCNEEFEIPNLYLNEIEVLEKLNKTKRAVHEALCDDFNTCLAIDELAELVNYLNKQFQQYIDPNLAINILKQNQTKLKTFERYYGSIMSVSTYVESTLEMFGLNYKINNQTYQDVKIDVILTESLKFRKSVRSIALNKSNSIPKECRNDILKCCDQMRDDFLKANVVLKDQKGETIWQFGHKKD